MYGNTNRRNSSNHHRNWRENRRNRSKSRNEGDDDTERSTTNNNRHPQRNYNQRYRNDNQRANRNDRDENEDSRRGNRNEDVHTRRNDNRHSRKPRSMGFKRLEELIESGNPEEVLMVVSDNRKGFKELLDNSKVSPDMTVLIVQILSTVCDCTFMNSKTAVLQSAIESEFGDGVIKFIATLAVQNERDKRFNSHFWKDPDNFWNSLIKLSKHLHDVIPSSSSEWTEKLLKAMKINIPVIEESHKMHISDGIKSQVHTLYDMVSTTAKEVERKKELGPTSFSLDQNLEPPDDFRDLSVYPSVHEIITSQMPFLRENLVKGSYQNVNHYLDVQYRLLREDFVMPLRNGICKYINKPNDKLEDIKIYNNVKFLNAETVNEQNCYRVQFDFSKKKKNFQYENSKRFMYGSLVCFTEAENKFKSVFFAKIAERKIPDLERGQLIVGFSADVELPENLYDINFLLVESKVYFEPYYQVLNVLKNIQMENFPMERYIIQVRTDTRPPNYLLSIDPVFYRIENQTFWPLNWEERRFYGLNDAQSTAFQSALTREFAIIQGPPGTGKTFLGLKIAQTLLENKSAWYNKTPMLVICFTNHALDQFLEGLLSTTENVIRVGNQSKNQNLNNYNIRKRKARMDCNPAVVQKKIEVKSYLQKIANINDVLNGIERYDSVLPFHRFANIVQNFYESWFIEASTEEILDWLFEGCRQLTRNKRAAVQRVQQNEDSEGEDDHYVELEDEENNDEVDDVFDDITVTPFDAIVSVDSLRKTINYLENQLTYLNDTDQLSYLERERKIDDIRVKLLRTENMLDYLQLRLEEGRKRIEDGKRRGRVLPPKLIDMKNPHNMLPEQRWHLYFYWLWLYESDVRQSKEAASLQFRRVYSVYRDLADIEDTQVMKDALVVGMTTTGAARLNSSLQALKSPIVIVEEAAEVLEAHIISALTSHCQHLILIGDHQQLKPSTASFTIETKFKLNISLFQRMVDNNVQCHTLNIQHRMRPEIANLIRPTIYSILHDHESVLNRPSIMGVEHNLFFINHNEQEQVCSDNSKKNIHEARFLIQFARHLILNGYKPENLIILAAYLGQMFEMQRERKLHSHLLQDVRIAVLDNYQGEESDIVLLSLVRSNKEKKIGFLKIENRVCVALSRARNGFYVMGNMDHLCQYSEIWPKIRETLERQHAIGPYLELRCQIHKFKVTNVKEADDFLKLPEGGCELLCDAILECTHVCKRLCHVDDRSHSHYKCKEKCGKLLCDDTTHVCTKMCYQYCGPCLYPVKRDLNCGHTVTIECHVDPAKYSCTVPVETTLPCGHETGKPCFEDPNTFKCPFPCDTRVDPCGHACTRDCHVKNDPDHLQYQCMKRCQRVLKGCSSTEEPHLCKDFCFEECGECLFLVLKRRTKCEHFYKVACKTDVDSLECHKPCKKILQCGHKCPKKCDEICGDCQVIVEKAVPGCDHKIKVKCNEAPDRKKCNGKCPRLLKCGHVCGKKCNQDCTTQCKEMADCNLQSPCGHIIKRIKCYLQDTSDSKTLLSNCSEKCNVELECLHRCSGTCGGCHQGRFHKRCMEKCGLILVCNHECKIPCREACRPCQRPCQYRCPHSKCTKTCGDLCIMCKEECPRQCSHQKCKNPCGDICSVPPCTEKCKKRIRKCNHPCVGFCGDPCPKLCRICDAEELTEFFFGTEDEEDARFVLLADCGHILEATGLDQWLNGDDNDAIKPKVCPKCNTVIKLTQRYADFVKTSLSDLHKVKVRFYGSKKEIEDGIKDILQDLDTISNSFIGFVWINELIETIVRRLKSTKMNRRQEINKTDIAAIRAKVDLLNLILDPIEKEALSLDKLPQSSIHIKWILNVIAQNIDSISKQESNDIILEIDRLQRWIQFERIQYKPYLRNQIVKDKVDTITQLLTSPARYIHSVDKVVKSTLEDLKKETASVIQLTDVERREIVQAMGLNRGHWFKCPNGHPYAIGECGGAMQVSTCNECGVQIGGRNHSLLPTNAVATEMDGARYSAWSEQANMGNYEL